MNWTLEVVVVPVSDVDRAKAFYAEQLGFNVDHDTKVSEGNRIVQLTPPGSGCSIVVGEGIVPDMPPGSLKGLQLVVPDIHAARAQLASEGWRSVRSRSWARTPALSRTRSTMSGSSSSAIRTATGGPCSRYPPAASPHPPTSRRARSFADHERIGARGLDRIAAAGHYQGGGFGGNEQTRPSELERFERVARAFRLLVGVRCVSGRGREPRARAPGAPQRRGGRREDGARAPLLRRAGRFRAGSVGQMRRRCSRPGRSGRCSTSPRRREASLRSWWLAARGSHEVVAALARELRQAVADGVGSRGRSPGRWRHARRHQAAWPQAGEALGTRRGHLSRGRALGRAHPLRIVLGELAHGQRCRAARDRAALAGGRCRARPVARGGSRGAVPHDRRKPVLRDRGAGRGGDAIPADGPRRGARARSAPLGSGSEVARGGRGRCRRRPRCGCWRRSQATWWGISRSAWHRECSRQGRTAWRSATNSRG